MDEAGEAASRGEIVFTQILSLLKFGAGVAGTRVHVVSQSSRRIRGA